MSLFPLNRYAPEMFIAAFEHELVRIRGDGCFVCLVIGEDEVKITFPSINGECTATSRAAVLEVLSKITELDNRVQESCDEECRQTGLHSSNYELYLAYIDLRGHELTLGYFGAKVNTEWEAKFRLVNGQWEKVNF